MSTTTAANFAGSADGVFSAKLVRAGYFQGSGWKTYTPTVTGGSFGTMTAASARFSYRVIDNTLQLIVFATQTGAGTSTASPYSFTLPTGCFLKNAGLAGSAFIVAGAVGYFGAVRVLALGSVSTPGTFVITLSDTAGATGTFVQWGNTANAAIRLDQANVTMEFSGSFELDPSSPILAGTQ